MLLLLSGEGPSDIGATVTDRGGSATFDPGPLALIIDEMAEQIIGFSLLGLGCVRHLQRGQLATMAKEITTRPPVVIPSLKRPAGNAGDYRQAFALANYAKTIQQEEHDAVLPVLFRDSDGTRSDDPRRWANLVEAIEAAFKAAACEQGVAMVAKPKQEAWFICAMKEDPYQNCAGLEEESGNDNSPNSLKRKLEALLGQAGDKEALVNWLAQGGFDYNQVDMPSFNRFREALHRAMNLVMHA